MSLVNSEDSSLEAFSPLPANAMDSSRLISSSSDCVLGFAVFMGLDNRLLFDMPGLPAAHFLPLPPLAATSVRWWQKQATINTTIYKYIVYQYIVYQSILQDLIQAWHRHGLCGVDCCFSLNDPKPTQYWFRSRRCCSQKLGMYLSEIMMGWSNTLNRNVRRPLSSEDWKWVIAWRIVAWCHTSDR